MNLFEIDEAIMNGMEVDEDTGEILNAEWLDGLQVERDHKLRNIACWIRNLDSDAQELAEQIRIFQQRKKAAQNKADSLRKYLSSYLDGTKWSCPEVAVSFRKSDQVVITNLSDIPEPFLKQKDPEPDKTAIKQAIKSLPAGMIFPGAVLEHKLNIQIK